MNAKMVSLIFNASWSRVEMKTKVRLLETGLKALTDRYAYNDTNFLLN